MAVQTDILKHLFVSVSPLQQEFGPIPTLLFITSVPVLRPPLS